MGSRLSMPRGPAGTTEISHPKAPPDPRRRPFTSRQIVAPAAAFTMACLLFVYTRTSIRAAKANAQRHRDADSGGEGLNLLNESRRRHGLADRVENHGGSVKQLAAGAKEQLFGEDGSKKPVVTGQKPAQEDRLRAALRKRSESNG